MYLLALWLIFLWLEKAILASAAIGSPWLPVVIMVICSFEYFDISSKSIMSSSGISKLA